jgi:RNA polymerase primary sigma factor
MPTCQARRSAASPFETYLREIDATPLLTAEEERDLAYRVAEGDAEARDHMVRANLRLVVKIARGYQGQGVALEDLIAEGNLGLVRAVEAFDPALGLRFSTYASYWIKQSIQRAVINTGKAVRLPNYTVQLLRDWRRAAGRLQDELGRPPTPEEVAARLKLSPKKLQVIHDALRVSQAGLQSDGEEADQSLAGILSDDAPGPDARLAEADDLRQVLGLLHRLNERQATVLRLRFGLSGEEPLPLQQIGERLGTTRERVRQIERDALNRLRECLRAG